MATSSGYLTSISSLPIRTEASRAVIVMSLRSLKVTVVSVSVVSAPLRLSLVLCFAAVIGFTEHSGFNLLV